MHLPQQILQRAKDASVRIVLPEGHDVRIVEAAILATKEELAKITLLGDRKEILALANRKGLSARNIEVIDPNKII